MDRKQFEEWPIVFWGVVEAVQLGKMTQKNANECLFQYMESAVSRIVDLEDKTTRLEKKCADLESVVNLLVNQAS